MQQTHRSLWLVPWIALTAALIGSFVATWQAARASSARAESQYRERAAQLGAAVESRLDQYLLLVRGTAALFVASEHVSPQEFASFVGRLGVGNEHEGVRSISFAERIPADSLDAFEAASSTLHGRQIRVRPRRETDEYIAALYVAPADRVTADTMGFDLASDPVRRDALDRARDLGEPAISGALDFLDETGAECRGFLIVVPLYGPGEGPWLKPLGGPVWSSAPADLESRRAHLKGYIVGIFIIDDMVAAVVREGPVAMSFAITENAGGGELLYRSPAATPDRGAGVTEEITFGDAVWTMQFFDPGSGWPEWAGIGSHGSPQGRLVPVIALIGLVFSLAVFVVTRAQIHARQAAESAMIEAQRQRGLATASEQRFKNLADSAPVLIWITEADGRVRWFNRAALEFTARTLEELTGSAWRRVVHPDETDGAVRAFLAAQESRRSFTHELRALRYDGVWRWMLVTGRPQIDRSGNFLGFTGTGVDVTDQRLAIERLHEQAREVEAFNRHLERLNTELARSNLELSEFASLAAHDLKEPLRGMTNYARFLREDYAAQLPPPGRDLAETIERLAMRLGRLLDALMDYARVGGGELELEDVDLSDICRQTVENLSSQVRRPDVEVDCRPLPSVRCDPILASQVFANLIANGIKYNTSPLKKIEVGALPGPDGPILYVRDNGMGIPPQHHERIFRMFKRLHGRDTFGGGLGAGLAIVKKIVDKHGGRIWLASELGRGTTFYFTLSPRGDRPKEGGAVRQSTRAIPIKAGAAAKGPPG